MSLRNVTLTAVAALSFGMAAHAQTTTITVPLTEPGAAAPAPAGPGTTVTVTDGAQTVTTTPSAPAPAAVEPATPPAVTTTAPVADAVTLSTMHAAKGLEWDGVAVVGVREGLMPFVLSQEEPALSEERRLLHVAFTRARRALRVSWATANGNRSANRSRFLTGLTAEGTQSLTTSTTRKKRGSLRSRSCSVCGEQLHSAVERKLSRHEDCEATHDEQLMDALKKWRKATAESASVPAFVVFTDATLQAVAEAEPTTRAQLLKLPGIGTVKVDRYGEDCLKVVADHVAKRA